MGKAYRGSKLITETQRYVYMYICSCFASSFGVRVVVMYSGPAVFLFGGGEQWRRKLFFGRGALLLSRATAEGGE